MRFGFILLLFLVSCGHESDYKPSPSPKVTPSPSPSPTPSSIPSPTPTATPDPNPTPQPSPKQLEERYLVRFYYIAEDEQVDKTTCKVKTVGLKMEFQYKNLTKEKFDLLSGRTYCEVTDIHEATETTGKWYELRCNLSDNFLWLDSSCGTGKSVQFKHYYRPLLDAWGSSAMPEPGYAYGGTSK